MNHATRKKIAMDLLSVAKDLAEPVKAAIKVEVSNRELVAMRQMVAKPAPRVEITDLPGMSKSQVKSWIKMIVEARHELETVRMQYEAAIASMKNLEADEKKGVAALKEAATQMKEKGRYLVDTENGLLEFTAYMDTKRPGIKQMLFDPSTTPVGEKAGELLERVSAKLGEEVASAVGDIYRECYEDLSHTADAVKLMKIVSKTASVSDARLKKAGLSDILVSFKGWLSGEVDSVIKRTLNFGGNIKRWVKGFAERTNLVKKDTQTIKKSIDTVKGLIDDYASA